MSHDCWCGEEHSAATVHRSRYEIAHSLFTPARQEEEHEAPTDYSSECCDAAPLWELEFTYLEDTSIEVVALGQCSKCREHSLFEREGV